MMRWLVWVLGLGVLVPAAGAVPELTEAQRVQLDTAEDGYLPDEPAWTGLLTNVAAWDPGEAAVGYVPGAAVPDYGKIVAEPGEHRGGLFVVEGRYAGRQRVMKTQRAGAWGDSLVEWGVVIPANKPEASAGDASSEVVAVVYLVEPQGGIDPPREGQAVRILTRFYKLWTDVDAEGVERTYPVFVGRSASVIDGGTVTGRGGGVVVGGVVVLGGLLFLVLLAKARSGAKASRRERVLERLRHETDEDPPADDDADGLPDDPAAALARLEQRAD